jgi:hypothetical protein
MELPLPEGVQVGQNVAPGLPPLLPDAMPVLLHEGAQVEQTGPLADGTTLTTGTRLPPGFTGAQLLSQIMLGGTGVPGGGVWSCQWKIVVRSVLGWPSVGGTPGMGSLIARIVKISCVSRASTCQTLLPLASTHHLTTRHFWAGLPASWTVMIRPVGSSAG